MTTRVLASCAILALLSGCATRLSTQAPQVTVVWGDAYVMECAGGQAPISQDGEVVCPSGDSVETRGGHVGEMFAQMWDGMVQVVGGLIPRGVTP